MTLLFVFCGISCFFLSEDLSLFVEAACLVAILLSKFFARGDILAEHMVSHEIFVVEWFPLSPSSVCCRLFSDLRWWKDIREAAPEALSDFGLFDKDVETLHILSHESFITLVLRR